MARAISLDGVPDAPPEPAKPEMEPRRTWTTAAPTSVAPAAFGVGELTLAHIAATGNDPWQIRMRARGKYPELRTGTFPLGDDELVTLRIRVKQGLALSEIDRKFAEFVL